jgi:C-terminal processing protease CtpA/Prc
MLRCSCRLCGLFPPVARWDRRAQHLAHRHTRSSKPFHVDYTGLTLQPAADGLVVLYVAPDAPGARAGLKKGDQIISVDGLNLRAQRGDNTSRSEWKYGVPGKELVLQLSDGEVKKLSLAEYF